MIPVFVPLEGNHTSQDFRRRYCVGTDYACAACWSSNTRDTCCADEKRGELKVNRDAWGWPMRLPECDRSVMP